MKKLEEKDSLCVRKQCPHQQGMQKDGNAVRVCCKLAPQFKELEAAGMALPLIVAPFYEQCKLNPELRAA